LIDKGTFTCKEGVG